MSKNIALVADSACDMTDEMLNKYNVHLLPMNIIFPDESKEYKHRVEITEEEYHEKLKTVNEHPSTSQVNGSDIIELFTKLEQEGYSKILYISVGTGISGNYGTSNAHLKAYKRQGGKADVTIYDSKQASFGIGLIIIKAAKLIEAGYSVEEILDELERFRLKELKVTFTVENLKYLMKGGRISKFKYAFGTLLKINPSMEVSEEGKLEVFTKSSNYRESIETIIDKAYDFFENKENLACYITEGQADEGLKIAKEILQSKYPAIKIYNSVHLGAAIYTHSGPGTIEIDMFKDFSH